MSKKTRLFVPPANRPRSKPVPAPAPAPAPKVPTHICPRCQTAVAPALGPNGLPMDTLFVDVMGYRGLHCLRCWGEFLRGTIPALVLIPKEAPAEPAKP